MRFKNSPQLPGAGWTRAWHHHGSDTPTYPRTIYVLKSVNGGLLYTPLYFFRIGCKRVRGGLVLGVSQHSQTFTLTDRPLEQSYLHRYVVMETPTRTPEQVLLELLHHTMLPKNSYCNKWNRGPLKTLNDVNLIINEQMTPMIIQD